MRWSILSFMLLALLLPLVSANEDYAELEELTRSRSIAYALVASVLILVLIFMSMHKERSEAQKMALFGAVSVIVLATTAYLIGGTLFINNVSFTHGPVHWHADFEIWKCGTKIDLVDPTGVLNRVGTPVFHEHVDDRLHIEGPVIEPSHIDLKSLVAAVGGELTQETLRIPTNRGIIELRHGGQCSGEPAALQVFVYKVSNPLDTKKEGFVYSQTKIEDFTHYVLSPFTHVPPGDCIIIELDAEKESTTRMCESYTIAQEKGAITEA